MFMINTCASGAYNEKTFSFVIQVHFINVGVLKTIKGVSLHTNPKVFYNILYPNLWTTNIILKSKIKAILNKYVG